MLDSENIYSAPTRDALSERFEPPTRGDNPLSERYVAPTREPIQRTTQANIIVDRELGDLRQPIVRDASNRGFSIFTPTVTPTTPTNTADNSQTFGNALANYFGGGSGGSAARNYDNPITVVPGGSENNSNLGLIFVVIAIGGGAAYWYYKKGGFNG